MKQRRQPFASGAQQGDGLAHVGNRRDQIGVAESPYLTLEEGARYARFEDCANPAQAFYKWLVRKAAPVKHRGGRRGRILVERHVIDELLGV